MCKKVYKKMRFVALLISFVKRFFFFVDFIIAKSNIHCVYILRYKMMFIFVVFEVYILTCVYGKLNG